MSYILAGSLDVCALEFNTWFLLLYFEENNNKEIISCLHVLFCSSVLVSQQWQIHVNWWWGKQTLPHVYIPAVPFIFRYTSLSHTNVPPIFSLSRFNYSFSICPQFPLTDKLFYLSLLYSIPLISCNLSHLTIWISGRTAWSLIWRHGKVGSCSLA